MLHDTEVITKYSIIEQRLFTTLGCPFYWPNAVKAYEFIAIECFKLGPPTKGSTRDASEDALRRGLIALHHCWPERMTPEFDELINFE